MNLKTFCKENNIQQKELAELFGCGQGNISNIVNGSRSVTKLQLRLLIEKYGFDVIAKYCDSSERPAIDVYAPSIPAYNNNYGSGTQAVNGSGTQTLSDPGIVSLLTKQSEQISALIKQHDDLIQQQNRLIAIIENK